MIFNSLFNSLYKTMSCKIENSNINGTLNYLGFCIPNNNGFVNNSSTSLSDAAWYFNS